MRVALLTREYPPEVYGGAAVHVEYLGRELAGAEIVHSHTWYAQFAGHLAKLIHGIPHVATVHSLEPLRPWKAEQLGGGYALSSFCERTALESADAVIAVSEGSKRDILACYPAIDESRVRVIYNGIDTAQYTPDRGTDVLERYGVDPDRPSVVFVGRITRQKGVTHLLRAAQEFAPAAQLVLCAGAPDTAKIGAEVAAGVQRLRASRDGVIWIDQMLPKTDVIQLLSHATVFACPSIYEPLGIVNREPLDPEAFAAAFAERVNRLVADSELAVAMGQAGRGRAAESFAWPAIADETVPVYREVAARADPVQVRHPL